MLGPNDTTDSLVENFPVVPPNRNYSKYTLLLRRRLLSSQIELLVRGFIEIVHVCTNSFFRLSTIRRVLFDRSINSLFPRDVPSFRPILRDQANSVSLGRISIITTHWGFRIIPRFFFSIYRRLFSSVRQSSRRISIWQQTIFRSSCRTAFPSRKLIANTVFKRSFRFLRLINLDRCVRLQHFPLHSFRACSIIIVFVTFIESRVIRSKPSGSGSRNKNEREKWFNLSKRFTYDDPSYRFSSPVQILTSGERVVGDIRCCENISSWSKRRSPN